MALGTTSHVLTDDNANRDTPPHNNKKNNNNNNHRRHHHNDTTIAATTGSSTKGMPVPKSMADCLDHDDPVAALHRLADASAARAATQARALRHTLHTTLDTSLPSLLEYSTTTTNPTHPLTAARTGADAVRTSLDTIASGGSQASHDIRTLEAEKRGLDEHAAAVGTAVRLRQQSDRAAQSCAGAAWADAAQACQEWLVYQDRNGATVATTKRGGDDEEEEDITPNDPRIRQYAGEYALQQLQSTYDTLQTVLTQQYETAVQTSDLAALGQLTPILSSLRLDQEAVRLYKVYLAASLEAALKEQQQHASGNNKNEKANTPVRQLARLYNTAVSVLRHHLPMVSHCLHKADGAAAVVELVHTHLQDAVQPVLQQYQRDTSLAAVARTATHLSATLEEKCTGQQISIDYDDTSHSNHNNDTDGTVGGNNDGHPADHDDGGFSVHIGTLADVDVAMEQAAQCVQHSESYLRFLHHTCDQVNQSRRVRYGQEQERVRMERERLEWTTGKKAAASAESKTKEYQDLVILPPSTPLHEAVAEIGGQYATIERCLLLASMHRAIRTQSTNFDDPKYYRPLSTLKNTAGGSGGNASANSNSSHANTAGGRPRNNAAMQTALVETCLYAARRSTQRAVCTGHTGTASAMTNFTVECLTDVLLPVLTRRAEDSGAHPLKPGDGLLTGSHHNLFNNASNLIRQGGVAGSVPVAQQHRDEALRQQKRHQGIAAACAVLNDLEVAVHHVRQLETLLGQAVDRGFPPGTHETEQLRLCVKSLGPVAEGFAMASDSCVDTLESLLKPRIRAIVGEAVGSSDGTGASAFMGAVAGAGGATGDREMVRMKYDLDEETYNLMQLSEGYVSRLCSLLDELLEPLRRYLAPRLWDELLLKVIGTAGKRLETSLRKCHFTALGGFVLDSDMRDLLNYTKESLHSSGSEYSSNAAVSKACPALYKLTQIAKLLSADELDDVIDIIGSAKRKGNWDLDMDDARSFLCARVEFEDQDVNDLLASDQ